MIQLSPIVLQLIQLGATVLPQVIQAALTEISLFNAGAPPTPEQQAAIDAALAQAHAALQAAQPGGAA